MPQPSDPKAPVLEPTEPRLTVEQAAAAWFLFLDTTKHMVASPGPSALIGKAFLMTAIGETIRRIPPKVIDEILKENAQPRITT